MALRPSQPVPVTVVNFFPAFTPPRSGGELRYYHLYAKLAEMGFSIQMVNTTHPFVEPETVEHHPLCVEHRVPQTMAHHRLYQFMQHGFRQGECSAPVIAMATPFHRPFVEKARECIQQSRIVIFDYPLPLRPFLKGMKHPFLLAHSSHNVEGLMQRKVLRGPQGRLIADWMGHLQKKLCRRSDLVFACGEEDKRLFHELYGTDPTKIHVAPNGVDAQAIPEISWDAEARRRARKVLGEPEDKPLALFLGSHHAPNIEAANYILQELAPACPDVRFLIAGSVSDHVFTGWPENARLFGPFEDEQKNVLLQAANLAINPMFSGSGTNLKMLEFFSAGLPVVSTACGARGLLQEEGEPSPVRVAEREGFADAVHAVTRDFTLTRAMGRSARKQAETTFNWATIAENMANVLHRKTHRKVLVLNDFPVTPLRYGGQVRMLHHYQALLEKVNVTFLTQTPEAWAEVKTLAPGLEEINIPDSRAKTFLKNVLYGLSRTGCDDVASYLTSPFHRPFRKALQRELRLADALVVVHPFLTSVVPKKQAFLYESLNVETLLKEQLVAANFWGRRIVALTARTERRALERAWAVAVCSDENREQFIKRFPKAGLNGKGEEKFFLAPNGVEAGSHLRNLGLPWQASVGQIPAGPDKPLLKKRAGLQGESIVIFLGSGHPPNVEAARYALGKLVPRFPETLFFFIGGVCWMIRDMVCPRNALLFYEIDEADKNRLLALGDILLNPLSQGSGVSLKCMDGMAAGAALLATPIGARGLEIENGIHGAVTTLENFPDELSRLLNAPDRCASMGEAARELAWRRYDWKVTSREFGDRLEKALDRGSC